MQAVIGHNLVKQIPPRDRPFEVRDTRLKGLILRVQPSGVKCFYVEYGRGKRMRLGRADAISPEQARARAKEILSDAYRGEDPAQVKRSAETHTLRSFIAEVYQPWAQTNIRTSKATVARLKASFAEHLDKKLSELTPLVLEKWRSARVNAGAKASTVNRDLVDLKSSLNKAVRWGLLDANPIASVKCSRVDLARAPRFLSTDEERRLREALDRREDRIRQERASANAWRAQRGYELFPDVTGFADYLKPMVVLCMQTGMRRGELFGLRWSDVDLEGKLITLRGERVKSGLTRHLPLNSEAFSVLSLWKRQAPDPEGLVFPAKNGDSFDNIRRSWDGVLKSAEIKHFRFHDLRHHFASRLVMAGVDLNTVRELLGHADISMTLRYAHLAPEHKRAAVERLVHHGQ